MVQFGKEPNTPLPAHVTAERNNLDWKLHIEGELQPTLAWLAQHQVTELRIEPEGLSSIYQKYHANGTEAGKP